MYQTKGKYDVIVVGARCAGSSIALLLARRGLRVLLVDSAKIPSDTLSTHTIQLAGLSRLKNWDILNTVVAGGCRPYREISVNFGEYSLTGNPVPAGTITDTICCRRIVLDTILKEEAVKAGVEYRGSFPVREMIFDNGRVVGIKGLAHTKGLISEMASIVVGADGLRSLVARQVPTIEYQKVPSLTFSFYSYWSEMKLLRAELYVREGYAMAMVPTNNDLTIVVVQGRINEFDAFRRDIENNFLSVWDEIPVAKERLNNGRQIERFRGTSYQPNFFRKPWGDGWLLVGDAGCHKDSVTAQGITDAFFDAEMASEAIWQSMLNGTSENKWFREYHSRRDERLIPIYNRAINLAHLEAPKGDIERFLRAIATNSQLVSQFLGIDAGTVDENSLFSPENIKKVIS